MPILMDKGRETFTTYVMVPSSYLVQYFFTNPVLGIQTVARDQLVMEVPTKHELSTRQVFIYNQEIIVDGHAMKQINFLYSPDSGLVIDP